VSWQLQRRAVDSERVVARATLFFHSMCERTCRVVRHLERCGLGHSALLPRLANDAVARYEAGDAAMMAIFEGVGSAASLEIARLQRHGFDHLPSSRSHVVAACCWKIVDFGASSFYVDCRQDGPGTGRQVNVIEHGPDGAAAVMVARAERREGDPAWTIRVDDQASDAMFECASRAFDHAFGSPACDTRRGDLMHWVRQGRS
jgi:hypothetical protein